MKYHLNFDDCTQFKDAFSKKIDEFNDVAYKLFKSSQSVEWVGLGHDKTIDVVYSQIEELMKISENLQKFMDFLNTAMDNFGEGVVEVNTKFKEIKEIIDKEKLKRGGA